MNNEGNNPIGTPTYTDTETAQADVTLYQSQQSQGETLTLATANTPLTFTAYFSPGVQTGLSIVSTYDVYDTNPSAGHPEGNLIRKDCTATNTIPLSLIDAFTEAERGKIYTLNLFVKPTYLYVMSDPDLNNPTVTIE